MNQTFFSHEISLSGCFTVDLFLFARLLRYSRVWIRDFLGIIHADKWFVNAM